MVSLSEQMYAIRLQSDWGSDLSKCDAGGVLTTKHVQPLYISGTTSILGPGKAQQFLGETGEQNREHKTEQEIKQHGFVPDHGLMEDNNLGLSVQDASTP